MASLWGVTSRLPVKVRDGDKSDFYYIPYRFAHRRREGLAGGGLQTNMCESESRCGPDGYGRRRCILGMQVRVLIRFPGTLRAGWLIVPLMWTHGGPGDSPQRDEPVFS